MTGLKDSLRELLVFASQRLPTGVKVALRERLQVVERLDSPDPLRIDVSTIHELQVRRFSCAKEPETIEWLQRHVRPGDIVFDVGANIGAYALVAARLCGPTGKVYAFEPVAPNYAQLVKNTVLNQLGNIVVPLPVALSDATELIDFRWNDLRAGAAGLPVSSAAQHQGGESLCALGLRLDELVEKWRLPPPGLIKIDVDGAELAVLEGARVTLASPSVRTLLVEASDAQRIDRLRALLGDLGFECRGVYPRAHVSNCWFARR